MRRYKVRNRPFMSGGLWWQDVWLYEKSVEVRVPNDQVVAALIRSGKVSQAAEMMTNKLLGQEQVITMSVPITTAERLDKEYRWRGAWVPSRSLSVPVRPGDVRRMG